MTGDTNVTVAYNTKGKFNSDVKNNSSTNFLPAGGIIGTTEGTCLYMENVRTEGITVDAGSTGYAGSVIGGVLFSRTISSGNAQKDYWQIMNSAFTGNTVKAKYAGGLVGYLYMTMSDWAKGRQIAQLNFSEIDATDNTVIGSAKDGTGTILGYTNGTVPSGIARYGLYGLNVYDAGTKLYAPQGTAIDDAQYGHCDLDFKFVRITDLDTVLTGGVTNKPASAATATDKETAATGFLMGDVLYNTEPTEEYDIHQSRTEDSPSKLKYLVYDSYQSTFLELEDYMDIVNRAIMATGESTTTAAGKAANTTYSTDEKVMKVTYTSQKTTESESGINVERAAGNLYWKKATGFRIRQSDKVTHFALRDTSLDYDIESEEYRTTEKETVYDPATMLKKTEYTVYRKNKPLTSENTGLERFLIQVNFTNTDAPEDATSATTKVSIGIEEDASFVIDSDYSQMRSFLTIGQRRQFALEKLGEVQTFSRDIPIHVDLALKDIAPQGYKFEDDPVNSESPYLDIIYSISERDSGRSIDIPVGTLVTYGDKAAVGNAPISKSVSGNIAFFMDRNSSYDMTHTFDDCETTEGALTKQEQKTTDISIDIDFARSLGFEFEAGKIYDLTVSVYRSNSTEYPLGGGKITELVIPIQVESTGGYGFKMDVDPKALNVNIYNDITVLPFTTHYSNVPDGSVSARVEYTLYRKDSEGIYRRVNSNPMQLAVTYGDKWTQSSPIGAALASFMLWRYTKDGTFEETISYNDPELGERTLGTVLVTIEGGKITDIAIDSADNLAGRVKTVTETIKANNGIPSTLMLTGEQEAVTEATAKILEAQRRNYTENGKGSADMKLSIVPDAIQTIDEGNYKLVGQLIVSNAPVAEDFIIFNVNRSNVYPDLH